MAIPTSTCSNYSDGITGSYTVWYKWNRYDEYATGTTDYTWSKWNLTTDSYSQTDTTWYAWTSNYDCPNYYRHSEITEEQTDSERERLRQQEERRKLEKKQREEAEIKAKELLLDLIGEEQLKVYEETGRLLVHGEKYDYIVPKEGYIKKIEKNKLVDLCVHIEERQKFPLTDNVIAMKLNIEADENEVLQIANNHGSRDRPAELPKCACMN